MRITACQWARQPQIKPLLLFIRACTDRQRTTTISIHPALPLPVPLTIRESPMAEAVNVEDAQGFAATVTANGHYDLSENLTQYQTELNAYRVTQVDPILC
jgi:hypothetical protein